MALRLAAALVVAVALAGCTASLPIDGSETLGPSTTQAPSEARTAAIAPPVPAVVPTSLAWIEQEGEANWRPATVAWTPLPCDGEGPALAARPAAVHFADTNGTLAAINRLLGVAAEEEAHRSADGAWHWNLTGGGEVFHGGLDQGIHWLLPHHAWPIANTTEAQAKVHSILQVMQVPSKARLQANLYAFETDLGSGNGTYLRAQVDQQVNRTVVGGVMLVYPRLEGTNLWVAMPLDLGASGPWLDPSSLGVRAASFAACRQGWVGAAPSTHPFAQPELGVVQGRLAWDIYVESNEGDGTMVVQVDASTGAILGGHLAVMSG